MQFCLKFVYIVTVVRRRICISIAFAYRTYAYFCCGKCLKIADATKHHLAQMQEIKQYRLATKNASNGSDSHSKPDHAYIRLDSCIGQRTAVWALIKLNAKFVCLDLI